MKALYRTIITLCIFLAILFPTIGSAAAACGDSNEIRDTVPFDAPDVSDIFDKLGDIPAFTTDAPEFEELLNLNEE